MLVLSRKVSDQVIIGNTIRVIVLKVAGGTVKLGFIAPDDVTIYREEILHREQKTVIPPTGCDPRPRFRNRVESS